MSLSALGLIVLAAFIHATWNLLAKRAAPAGPSFILAFSVVASLAYLPWVLTLLLRDGLPDDPALWLCLCLSALLHLVYNLCLQRGYQVADFTVVYPVARGTGPLLSSLGAFILLAEQPTLRGIAGLLAIVTGILLISTQGQWSQFGTPRALQGVRWGTTTGGVIAGYTVVDAWGVKLIGLQPVVLDWCTNALRILMLLPWALRHHHQARAAMRGHWWRAVAVGLLSPLSYILVLHALQMGTPLSLAAPMRELSMMIAALLGALVLRERVGPWRLAGCLLMVCGVMLLSAH